MSYTLMVCPICQGEISTYFGPEGYDGTCVNCGYHVGNLWCEPKHVKPAPYKYIHVEFKMLLCSRVSYLEWRDKVRMPTHSRDYIYADTSFIVEIPKDIYDKNPVAVDFRTDLEYFIEGIIKSCGYYAWEDVVTRDDRSVIGAEYVMETSRDDDAPIPFSDLDTIAEKVREQVALKYKLN